MIWTIKYYFSTNGRSDVEAWFNKLTIEQAEAVGQEIAVLKKAGNKLQLPHSKPLGNKLFELRERKFGYRIYYTFKENKVIVLLVAGNKSSQDNLAKIEI